MRKAEQAVIALLGAGVAGIAWAEPVALPAGNWDRMYDIWLAIAVAIYLIVAVPMLYFLTKYRYRPGVNEGGSTEEGGPGIEILWTVVPLIIMIYLATQSFALYAGQRTAPPDAMPIKVDSMMWAWMFEYPNGKQSTQELVIPVGKPVKLLLTSKDVIHSFHIPAAKVMEDAVPGRVTELWFQFLKPGEYRGYCREYCGTAHAFMQATLKVVEPAEFEAYRAAVDANKTPVTLDALGEGLYNAGDHIQAVRVLREAVEMNPDYGPALVHLGMALYARRNYEDAVTNLEKGLPLVGDTAREDYLYTAGLAHINKEPRECALAEPWLRKALAKNPNSEPALAGLRICASQTAGDTEQTPP